MRTSLHHLAIATALVLSACSPGEPEAVWFIHATDPHLFQGPDGPEQTQQDRLNRETFERLLAEVADPPGTDAEPRFLLLTGDIGFGEPGDDGEEPGADLLQQRVRQLAEMLEDAGDLTIYYVPGNNDAYEEQAGALAKANRFIAEVGDALASSGVTIRDLTACYPELGPSSGCTADVADTRFRLIGFPTHSFKTKEPEQGAEVASAEERQSEVDEGADQQQAEEPAGLPVGEEEDVDEAAAGAQTDDDPTQVTVRASTDSLHEAWVKKLRVMVAEARNDGRKVLIATHIPELDDPWILAQEKFSDTPRYTDRPGRPRWSAWGVSQEVFETWREIVDRSTVAAVFAGHFHTPQREIYRPAYDWEGETDGLRADREKILVAPPLAVKRQDSSPIQARGFALVRLAGDDVLRRLVWYDAAAERFVPDEHQPGPGRGREGERNSPVRAWSWLWNLDPEASTLVRATIVVIALLAAFLTMVALWETPPPDSRLTSDEPAPAPKPQPSPFTSNLAKTILAGLTGMVGAVVIDDDLAEHTLFYFVCFIAFFFVSLTVYATWRGLVEMLRSRVASTDEPVRRAPRRVDSTDPAWLYWPRRAGRWALSLRAALLVFWDSFFNVVQGKNQLENAVLGKTIVKLQTSLVDTLDQVTDELHRVIREVLFDELCRKGRREDLASFDRKDIRVNVSVLSAAGDMLSYVSLDKGSKLSPFGQRSVAWVAARTGEARWWKASYRRLENKIVMFDNSKEKFEGFAESKVFLKEVFAPRGGVDYEGFLVFPIPWYSRDESGRRGVLHVSFRKVGLMELLWPKLEQLRPTTEDPNELAALRGDEALVPSTPKPPEQGEGPAEPSIEPLYDQWRLLVKTCPTGADPERPCVADARLATALQQGLGVLPQVLQHFNPSLFKDLIKPR